MSEARIRVFVRNLGCKVNLADAASVVDLMDPVRFRLVNRAADADIMLLNTCTVTHKADRDVRKILGAAGREQPDLPVVVAGCAVATLGDRISEFGNVRAIVAPGDPAAVTRAIAGSSKPSGTSPRPSPFARLGRQRAFVKVQDGCNARCAYCIVPRARGRERSLPVEDVVGQMQRLTSSGHRELVLCGVHLGRYGADMHPPIRLPALLDALADVFDPLGPGFRLRLSSIEPLEWTAELMDAVERHPFLCAHFHVPLQSGADSVLGRMGRPYRVEQFERIIRELSRRFPPAAMGTDVLVGFPGESEDEALATLECLRGLPLAYLHVFTFSPRPDTRAATMPHRVDTAIVRRRAARLRTLGRQHWRTFLAAGLGHTHQALLEKQTPEGSIGRTRSYLPIRVEQGTQPGQMVEVVADRLETEMLVSSNQGHTT